MITVRMPTNITNSTLEFLDQSQFIFDHKGRETSGVALRYDRVRKMSLLSQLLLYKFIHYTSTNRCFSNPQLYMSDYVKEELKKSGFHDLVKFHLRAAKDESKKEEKVSFLRSIFQSSNVTTTTQEEPLNSLISTFKDNIYIAPLILLRNDHHRFQLESNFIKSIKNVYKDNSTIIDIVTKCLTEIYMNFWEHATIDSGTVMVAKGSNKCFELMFADNGNGILSTLQSAGYNGSSDLLAQSIRRGVTSKPKTNHMGWGLWMVATLCTINNGELEIYSEGKYLGIKNGKINNKDCGYWKGTIIHLTIPFEFPKSLSSLKWKNNDNIKINWG